MPPGAHQRLFDVGIGHFRNRQLSKIVDALSAEEDFVGVDMTKEVGGTERDHSLAGVFIFTGRDDQLDIFLPFRRLTTGMELVITMIFLSKIK